MGGMAIVTLALALVIPLGALVDLAEDCVATYDPLTPRDCQGAHTWGEATLRVDAEFCLGNEPFYPCPLTHEMIVITLDACSPTPGTLEVVWHRFWITLLPTGPGVMDPQAGDVAQLNLVPLDDPACPFAARYETTSEVSLIDYPWKECVRVVARLDAGEHGGVAYARGCAPDTSPP